MHFASIALSKDQVKLAAEASKAVDTKSTDELQMLSESGQRLFESLENAIREKLQIFSKPQKHHDDKGSVPERAPVLKRVLKLPEATNFVVRTADVVIAIPLPPLPGSERKPEIKIFAPSGIPYGWPAAAALIIPRGWSLRSIAGDSYANVMFMRFGEDIDS
ncbi:uncharacterized protein LMH87_007573 [Akanthomyces muscarius]|uniref:Uncharacterized protein n=1 Tax=Akanthomyces muscarius TaxID=2231603 RepID=A0A9W8QJE3_AKAMU|nr:uncharacterized protein LMH87_007573 [Akanthomyces muscarius]KAJ4161539.1 hypothetical protein LMH87_007573 [Akanthomyces muscarius]